MKLRLVPLFVAAALAAGSAQAADKTPAPSAAPTAAQKEAARAEIDRLVKRIDELSQQLGDDGDVRVIVRKQRHGPGEPGKLEFFEGDEDAPRAMPDDGRRIERIERVGPNGERWKVEGMPPPMAMDMHGGPGLGVVLAPNTAAAGVKIAAVTPDSPAMKSGLRTGDVIMQVNGKAISGNGNDAVENARKMIGELQDGQVVKLRYARQGKTYDAAVTAAQIQRVMAFRRDDMPRGEHWKHEDIEGLLPPGVDREIQLIGPRGDCGKGKKDCGMPHIYEAFRWQGLNLASIDAGLGRYFGTQQGVLVVSSGEDLKDLQSGDVIQKVGGVAVESPRDVMRALRNQGAGSKVAFDVLRNKRVLNLNVVVPEERPLPFMTPPPPPAPPAPPAPPTAARMPAPPAPPAPPPPPGAPRVAPPAPPAPPAAPTPPPREGAMWRSEGDGDAYVVTVDDEGDMDADFDTQVEVQVAAPVAR